MSKKGRVILVGAGPGDIGLLTLKGAEIISKAEVVVYDRLVSDEILALIPDTAMKIDVGKSSNHHHIKQDMINKILLEHAQKGKYVVRLKGGDPFLFGRGGEELELLQESNIPFEVVPGVTSAISALAYGGIPVTHRDFCSSLHIITGHARADGKLNINFNALAELKGTIVFMMGVATLRMLMDGLLTAGMKGDTPAAIIENGTRANQRRLISTISGIASAAEAISISSPSVVAVGDVCSLSDKFDWFMK